MFDYDRANSRIGKKLVASLAALPGGDQYAPSDIGRAFGRANGLISKRFAQLDYYLHADMFRATFLEATKLLELEFDEAVYAEFSGFQHKSVVAGLQLKGDCQATLKHLKSKGLYLSIVSNIDEDMLQPLVERESLHDVLDDWTSSEAAQSCKPHHRFFEISLEKANLAPECVLFVGDSPEHDINGAGSMGMQTVLIKNGDFEAPLQSGAAVRAPHHTIRNLNELIGLV